MDLVTTSFALYIFCCVFLMNIAIRDYVIAINSNGFGDNFFALYIFRCDFLILRSGITLLQLTVMDLVTTSSAPYIFCCVF